MKNFILFLGFKTLGQISWFNNFIRQIYLYLAIPLLTYFLKSKFSNLVHVKSKQSINEKRNFNAFLSDIDLYLVVKNNTDYQEIIEIFFEIMKIFPMLDFPEVYHEDEFSTLEKLLKSEHRNAIYTIWSLRKINWNIQSMRRDLSRLNKIKKNRSINISLSKILKVKTTSTREIKFKELHCFNNLQDDSPLPKADENICNYSQYLETNTPNAIIILMNNKQFNFLNSILPGESASGDFLELRTAIAEFEILITTASVRLDKVRKIDRSEKLKWINALRKSL